MDELMCKRVGEQMAAASLTDNIDNFRVMAETWHKWVCDEPDEENRKRMNIWMAEGFCRECNRTGVANSGWGTEVQK